jgi:phosphomannomutase
VSLIKSVSGIRGTIGGKPGEGLTPEDIVSFSAAFGRWIINSNRPRKVVIGRDGRISGEMVKSLVTGTLRAMGIEVIDIDLTTTPTIELAIPDQSAGGGIIITASHNPAEWNALKLMDQNGEFVSPDDCTEIIKIAESRDYEYARYDQLGQYHCNTGYVDFHLDKIEAMPLVDKEAIAKRKFRIVVDCVNSTGGIVVPRLLNRLGVTDLVELFCAPNGRFPHNPEPLPENLSTLSNEVRFQKADLGIAVDPDVDRLALVCEDGSFFGEEYTLVAISDYVLSNQKGPVVANLSTTRAMEKIAEKHQVPFYASAVGEVHVVAEMKKRKAVIGGEGNGGVIYPAIHYGRDALAGIALFLSHLAKSNMPVSRLRSSYPDFSMVKSKIMLDDSVNLANVLDEIRDKYKKYPVNSVDGVKISFDNDWVHLRKSNTEPIIRIYAESRSETTAKSLVDKLIIDIKTLINSKV